MLVWLEKRMVVAIHDRQLAEHGGSAGIRDESLLESALARPQQLHAYADLAASLAYGLARNHPFVDGNKRTAFASCLTFLALNGLEVEADSKDKYLTFLSLGEGSLPAAELAAWLREHIPSIDSDRVQETALSYTAE